MPPKAVAKTREADGSRALEAQVDVDMKRLIDALAKMPTLSDHLTTFTKRMKSELNAVRDGSQPNIPDTALFITSPMTILQTSTMLHAFDAYPWLGAIQLHHCNLGNDGVRVVCDFIGRYSPASEKRASGVHTLELPGCNISEIGAKVLGALLASNTTIRALCLDFNPLEDSGAAGLSSGVKWNSTLQLLSLQYCRIGAAGGEAVGQQIIGCSNVAAVSLRGNPLGEAGIRGVADGLPLRTAIVALDVANTGIGADIVGIDALCSGLTGNTSIQALDLNFNTLSADGMKRLLRVVREHPTLVDVTVHERVESVLFLELLDLLESKRGALVAGTGKRKGGKKSGK